MKNKIKTHKSTAKRFKITASGKVVRQHRQSRNSRTPRQANKSTNSDVKQLKLAHVEAKKVKKLLNTK